MIKLLQGEIPGWVVKWMIAPEVKKNMHAQGMGRHTPQEVEHIGKMDLNAISDFLGEFCDEQRPTFFAWNPSKCNSVVNVYCEKLFIVMAMLRFPESELEMEGRKPWNLNARARKTLPLKITSMQIFLNTNRVLLTW